MVGCSSFSFSILIVSWNTKDLLLQCLFSIYENFIGTEFEVIVVDNNSLDGSVEALSQRYANFNNFYLVCNSLNKGFAEGNNQAFKLARFDNIVLLNPDTKLIDQGIIELVKNVRLNPKTGLVSCKLFNENVLTQTIHRRLPNLVLSFFRYSRLGYLLDRFLFRFYFRRKYKYENIEFIGQVIVEQPAAAVLVFRKELVLELGYLFDKEFPIYGNDVDLSKRVLDLGYINFVDYNISIWHQGSSSVSNFSNSIKQRMRREWIPRYFLKHYGKIPAFISRIILFV
ncbi:glycosyltransferase family 2 protein [Algoriphagus sp. oki45]|uniref:glycosyltransferase n=1 Tax=Algoriphagus sp. oki45 TaxID=3067294 RepID=UPI0027EC9CB9|nr:glycosyltransferase family 2 protein [Algoriphagus sp. oki45]